MADVPRFQNAPSQYDVRDQVEFRRTMQVVIDQLRQEVLALQSRVRTLEAGSP